MSRKKYADIFKEWAGDDESGLVSKEEVELSEDFCTYLDSHFDTELKELIDAMAPNDKVQNMAACLLSIYDSLKLADNEQLWEGETLTEMMFRKMKGYNIDLNKELGFTHLKPVPKKKS